MIIILITTFHFLNQLLLSANMRESGLGGGFWKQSSEKLSSLFLSLGRSDSPTRAVRWRPDNWGSFTKDLSLTNLLARRPATKHLIEIPRKPHQMNWLLTSGEGNYQLDNNFTRQSTCYPITRACIQDSCVLSWRVDRIYEVSFVLT